MSEVHPQVISFSRQSLSLSYSSKPTRNNLIPEISTAVLILISGFLFAQNQMKTSSTTPSSHRENSNIAGDGRLTPSQKAEAARQARELLPAFSKSDHKAAPQLRELRKQCVALLKPLSNPKFTDATEGEAVKHLASFLRENATALKDPKIYPDGRLQSAVDRAIILSGAPPQEFYCFVYCGHEYYYLIKALTKL
jgi:hypothetical protein